jgi:hypothetical protein
MPPAAAAENVDLIGDCQAHIEAIGLSGPEIND